MKDNICILKECHNQSSVNKHKYMYCDFMANLVSFIGGFSFRVWFDLGMQNFPGLVHPISDIPVSFPTVTQLGYQKLHELNLGNPDPKIKLYENPPDY